jgi:hypothetical protein
MAAAGVHPTTIAALIGHSDGGALLMRRYRHLFPDEAGRAVAAFDRLVLQQASEVRSADS